MIDVETEPDWFVIDDRLARFFGAESLLSTTDGHCAVHDDLSSVQPLPDSRADARQTQQPSAPDATPESTRTPNTSPRRRRVGAALAGSFLALLTSGTVAGCGSLGPSCGGEFFKPACPFPLDEHVPAATPRTPHNEEPANKHNDPPGFTVRYEDWPWNLPADEPLKPANKSVAECRKGPLPSNNTKHNPRGAKPAVRPKGKNPMVGIIDTRCFGNPRKNHKTGLFADPTQASKRLFILKNGARVAIICAVEDGQDQQGVPGEPTDSTVWLGVNAKDGTKDGKAGYLPWGVLGYVQLLGKAKQSCSAGTH